MNYDNTAKESSHFARAGWSSHESLFYRYIFLEATIEAYLATRSPRDQPVKYLDIGCNDAYSINKIVKRFRSITEALGIEKNIHSFNNIDQSDLTSINNNLQKINFENIDFMDFKCKEKYWNLISLIGLLQIKDLNPLDLLCKIEKILAPQGRVILTTLNLDWQGFDDCTRNKPSVEQRWWSVKELNSACNSANLRITSHFTTSIRQQKCYLYETGGYIHLCTLERFD